MSSPADARSASPAFATQTSSDPGLEWRIADEPVDYAAASAAMEARAAAIRAGTAPEQVWLLEHPPIYTAGTSARAEDLRDPRFAVHKTGRGGQYTYHGPGQRIAYVMLDLKRRPAARCGDIRGFVHDLEEWVIRTLARFQLRGERRERRVGVWIDLARHGRRGEAKIAAIGVRVRRWVTLHGLSLNVEPDLSHYAGIVPCGIDDAGVTSLVDLGLPVTMADVDMALRETWPGVFGQDGPGLSTPPGRRGACGCQA